MGLLDFLIPKKTTSSNTVNDSVESNHMVTAAAGGTRPNGQHRGMRKSRINYSRVRRIIEKRRNSKMNNVAAPAPEEEKPGNNGLQVERYLGLAAMKMDNGKWEDAEELFLYVLELDEKATLAYANLGILYSMQDQTERALEYYDAALEIEPDRLFILENKLSILQSYTKDPDHEHMVETARQILEIDPDNYKALVFLVEYYIEKKDVKFAFKYLKVYYRGHSEDPYSLDLLNKLLNQIDKRDILLKVFDKLENGLDKRAEENLHYYKDRYLVNRREFQTEVDL